MISLYAVLQLSAQQEAKESTGPYGNNVAAANGSPVLYTAFFDNRYKVQLHLTHRGAHWQGTCVYPSSNTRFYVEGEQEDGEVLLFEKDSTGASAGVWLLKLSSDGPVAHWHNNDGTVQYTVNLIKGDSNKKAIGSSRVLFYNGKIFGDKYTLTLYHETNKAKSSLLNATKNFFITHKTACIDEECNNFVIKTINFDPVKKLECYKNNAITLRADVYNSFNSKHITVFNLMEQLKMKDTAYIGKDYMFYVTYPVFENKKVNASFQREILKIAGKMKRELDSIAGKNDGLDARLETFAAAWFDVDFYSPQLFSGRFFIQKSYKNGISVMPVVFNLQTGKKVDISGQFKPDFNFKFFAKQYIKEHIKEIPGYKSSMARNFLIPANFKYFTVNNTGIVISTGFNTMFGDFKMIIPFDEIKDNIKRRSILRKIVRY